MPITRDASREALLLAFYHGGRDQQGRTHGEMLAWPDTSLEAVHDYIQWLFPLPEPSAFNLTAPVATPQVVEAFRRLEPLHSRLEAAYARMLRFYGFSQQADGTVVRASFFPQRAGNWLTPQNHNHLRLTRILRSLHLLGLEQESTALFMALAAIYAEEARGGQRISTETFRYWQNAAHRGHAH